MRKYGLLLSLGFQDALQYRAEGIIWFLFDVVPPLMMIFVWLAAFRDTDEVAGYSLGAMLSYYLGLALLRNILTTNPEWEIAESVRNGKLSMLLLKPIHPWGYWLAGDSAWRVLRLVMVVPVLFATLLLLGGRPQPPSLSPGSAMALALCLPLAYLLCYVLKICLGFAGFWLLDIGGLAGAYHVVVLVLGGTLVPLELMPPALRLAAELLPFKYVYAFPLAVSLGRVGGAELWSGLAIQAAWTAVLFVVARTLWSSGLRRYESAGA